MNKTSATFLSRHLLTAALLSALALPVLAQPAPAETSVRALRADAPPAGPRGHGPRAGHDMGHAFEQLDLSEAQHDQLFRIRHQAEPALHESRKALRQAHMQLRTLQRADTLDPQALESASAAVGAATAEHARLSTQRNHALHQVLTPAQRSQLDAARQDGRRAGPNKGDRRQQPQR